MGNTPTNKSLEYGFLFIALGFFLVGTVVYHTPTIKQLSIGYYIMSSIFIALFVLDRWYKKE